MGTHYPETRCTAADLSSIRVRKANGNSLDDIVPLIWRRLVVPSRFNLRDLHLVLEATFGWMNAHLYEFQIGGLRFEKASG
jgi:hypothetical protein